MYPWQHCCIPYIQIDNQQLEKLVISMKKGTLHENDNEIFLPTNMKEMFDFEYIFHTHPPTPSPGGRVKKDYVLYEFPSVQDIIHFIEHYNYGVTQGSIVMAPEGMYIITKKNFNGQKIEIDKEKFEKELDKIWFDVQNDAITQYGETFTNKFFYEEISQNKKYINKINSYLNKYDLIINFYLRSKDKNGNWTINNVYIQVYPIEPK